MTEKQTNVLHSLYAAENYSEMLNLFLDVDYRITRGMFRKGIIRWDEKNQLVITDSGLSWLEG